MAPQGSDWVVITGSSGSLGSAVVDHFAALGRSILALDMVPGRQEWMGDAGRVTFRRVDLAGETDVAEALDSTIAGADRIALLVNAVGSIWNEPVLRLQGAKLRPHAPESWRRVIDSNLTAAFIAATQVAARMARSGGGLIVNFSSVTAQGNVGQVAYSAAKAGIESMTRTMASELGQSGIRVNAIAPGFVDVPSTRAALNEQQLKTLTDRTPVRRLGRADEILAAIDFLAAVDFVNGTVIHVDGGFRI